MSDIVAQILKDRDRRPGQQENEPVGEFLWRLLRESVHFTTKSILNADIKDVFIGHGVHHVRKIRSLEPVQHVLMNDDTNVRLTLSLWVVLVRVWMDGMSIWLGVSALIVLLPLTVRGSSTIGSQGVNVPLKIGWGDAEEEEKGIYQRKG